MARLRDLVLKHSRNYPNTIPGALFGVVLSFVFYTAFACCTVWFITKLWLPWLTHHAKPVPVGWFAGLSLFAAADLLRRIIWRRRRPRIAER